MESVSPDATGRCQACTRTGSRCKRKALIGERLCLQHFMLRASTGPEKVFEEIKGATLPSASPGLQDKANTSPKAKKYLLIIEKLFVICGVIGLASLDDDFVRWTHFATKIVAIYRELTYPLFDALSEIFNIHLPQFVRDLLSLFCSLFAGANAHSLRLRNRLVLSEALRIVNAEYFQGKVAEVPEGDFKYYLVTIYAALSMVVIGPIFGLMVLLVRGLYVDLILYSALYIYIQQGVFILANASSKFTAGKSSPSARRRYAVLKFVFLPSVILQVSLIIIFTILAIVLAILLAAWRMQLKIALVLLVIVALNELDLRFFKQWTISKPDCIFLSIPDTCRP